MIEVSKKVYVRRRPRTVTRGTGEEMSYQDSKPMIGSSLKGQEVLRGLEVGDEEKRYLKDIVGISPTSEKWEESTKKYWSNIRVYVPTGLGLELEIGFKYKTEEAKALGEASDNYAIKQQHGDPISPTNYVLWRYCLVYSHVSNNLDEVENSPKIRFYLFSKEEDINLKTQQLELRKKAYTMYLTTAGDRDKVQSILTVLQDPAAVIGNDKEKDMALESRATANPAEFIRVCTDSALTMKAFIENCIAKGHLRRIENTDTIIYGSNTPIGNNIDDAVAYLNSANNATIYNNLKAKMNKFVVTTPAPVATLDTTVVEEGLKQKPPVKV